ncbi:MAG TPA: PTS glucose transporter subunit IIBC, partial [Erysipelothrix sp.]|nr:PTS glucose transporter subunit IIBC [Erysipelothrix sp.]
IYLEELQLPIKSLFIGLVLITLGSFLGNPYINEILKLDFPLLLTIKDILLFAGGLVIKVFPYMVFIKLLYTRTKERNIVVVGIISYLIYLIMILFLTTNSLPDAAYASYLNFTIGDDTLRLMNTGYFGLLGIYIIVRRTYHVPLNARNANFTKVLDRDTIRLLRSLIYATLFGIAMAIGFPYVIEYMYRLMSFIAADFSNPMSLFAYSGFERLAMLVGLEDIVRQEMWFTSMGGTWNSLESITYVGDVNIWAAQLADSATVIGVGSAGRFTSMYYVVNLFAAPAYLFAMSKTVTDPKKRNKAYFTVILGSILSITTGIIYPLEIIMVLTAPIIYLFHLFMVGFISAVLLGLSITIGFSYLGILSAAIPGNIIDLISIFRKNIITQELITMLLFGVIVFIIYYYVIRFYYKNVAIDILNIGIKDDEVTDFIERVGGLDNIESFSSLPTKVIVKLKDEDDINTEGLHYQGVTKIIHTREGFTLSYGAGSYILQNEVNKRLKMHHQLKEDEDGQ